MGLNAFTRQAIPSHILAALLHQQRCSVHLQPLAVTNTVSSMQVPVTVFLGYGSSAPDASNNAVQVTGSTSVFPLLPNTDEILTFVQMRIPQVLRQVVQQLSTSLAVMGCKEKHVKSSGWRHNNRRTDLPRYMERQYKHAYARLQRRNNRLLLCSQCSWLYQFNWHQQLK